MMHVSGIYIYPIKSLRGIYLPAATLTPQGIAHDRRFMLRQVLEDGSRKNMGCYKYPLMVRFLPTLEDDGSEQCIRVTFQPTDGTAPTAKTIPLEPEVEGLAETTVTMHSSPATGYEMGPVYDAWFSACFGFAVELIYIGQNRRKVLGNLSPNNSPANTSWMQTLTRGIPLLGSGYAPEHEQGIAFSDIAALLVVSETSLRHITRGLPDGMAADMTKFRPNIVVSGSEEEYSEDYWSQLDIAESIRILLTANCNRCVSLNLDYDTGDFAVGPAGKVLAYLSKDRRVDAGAKYSPTFGRYGFVERNAHGKVISVGDAVEVTGRNKERTKFYWPGVGGQQ